MLGSYAPKVKSNVKELRLRFSRVKFWLGVGAAFNPGTRHLATATELWISSHIQHTLMFSRHFSFEVNFWRWPG